MCFPSWYIYHTSIGESSQENYFGQSCFFVVMNLIPSLSSRTRISLYTCPWGIVVFVSCTTTCFMQSKSSPQALTCLRSLASKFFILSFFILVTILFAAKKPIALLCSTCGLAAASSRPAPGANIAGKTRRPVDFSKFLAIFIYL